MFTSWDMGHGYPFLILLNIHTWISKAVLHICIANLSIFRFLTVVCWQSRFIVCLFLFFCVDALTPNYWVWALTAVSLWWQLLTTSTLRRAMKIWWGNKKKVILPNWDRRGHICPPCHVFAYICTNTRTSALKNLTFPNYKFRKGQYVFYPVKLPSFADKNEVCQK